MYTIILMLIIFSIVMCAFTHEYAHYLTAMFFGKTIKFKFSIGKLFNIIPIPRWTWTMPNLERYKQKIIALSGFIVEELIGVLVLVFIYPIYEYAGIYSLIAILHLALYNLYAGEDSDFNWI